MRRREDQHLIADHGGFAGDISHPDLAELGFRRSRQPHATVRSITKLPISPLRLFEALA